MAQKLKDYVLLALFFAVVIVLLPILIPLFIIDDLREDSFNEKQSKAAYYQRYL